MKRILFSFLLWTLLFFNVIASDTGEDDPKTSLRALKDPKTVEEKHVVFSQNKAIIVLDEAYGLCNQLVNMLCQIVYLRDKGIEFMVDESTYGYRWNSGRGVLSLFFNPSLPLITSVKQYPEIEAKLGIPDYKSVRQLDVRFDDNITTTTPFIPILKANGQTRKPCCNPAFQDEPPLSNNKQAMVLYELKLMEQAYKRMSDEACASLQINEWAIKRRFQPLKDMHRIPDFRQQRTVAFHVRRGDSRLKADAKLYPGSEHDDGGGVKVYPGYAYVEKLLDVTLEPIDHCFIATDDYAAVAELTAALQWRDVNCTVHSMIMPPDDTGKVTTVANDGRPLPLTTGPATAHFLAELSILVDATYFIGTFQSNVAAFVALQRKCVHDNTVHYAHSYGVDIDHWWMV